MLCTFGFVDDVTVVINGQAYVKLIVGMLIVIHQGQRSGAKSAAYSCFAVVMFYAV